MTQNELKREFDRWAMEYSKKVGRFPTVSEMLKKAKELGLEKF